MASGCIMGYCPVCSEHIWEDNWRFFDDVMMHPECVKEYLQRKQGISNEQFIKLCEAQDIKKSIEDLKETFKVTMDFYSQRLDEIESEIKKISKG